eukprot:Seg3948.2 transcript_id=Seg3948.2/GoldUCD/mRNA.D3Y31 product="hypothetical protein" protein_id=Seg3948.2/GoldUCD/D3Y31
MAANSEREAVDRARRLRGLPENYLKQYQENPVIDLLRGKDTFVAQPTGAGKSLVYQLLPLASDFLAHPDREIEIPCTFCEKRSDKYFRHKPRFPGTHHQIGRKCQTFRRNTRLQIEF